MEVFNIVTLKEVLLTILIALAVYTPFGILLSYMAVKLFTMLT